MHQTEMLRAVSLVVRCQSIFRSSSGEVDFVTVAAKHLAQPPYCLTRWPILLGFQIEDWLANAVDSGHLGSQKVVVALDLAQAQEKDQNACRACLVPDFSTAFVPSLVLTLARARDGQVVLVASVGVVQTWLATPTASDQTGFVADLENLACGHLPDSAVAVLGRKVVEVVTVLRHLRWASSGLEKNRVLEVAAGLAVPPA